LHSSIAKYHPQLEVRLEALTWMQAGNYITFEVNGIGESHNALALYTNVSSMVANQLIVIISHLKLIEPIVVEAKLKKEIILINYIC